MSAVVEGIDQELADQAIEQVRRWLVSGRDEPMDAAATRLAGVLHDPHGLEFTAGFVDGVIRPEDARVAARNLAALVPIVPRFLPAPLRGLVRAGAVAGRVAPGLVVPMARKALRRMVRHLIADASDRSLGRSIARLGGDGIRLNINLLGEAVLGDGEAAARLSGTEKLLRRSDIDYVSIKVSGAVPPHSPFGFDAAVRHAVDALRPLYRIAAAAPVPKFINLDMEEYRDLALTIAVFKTLLGEPEFLGLQAGIVLQAYLPDALSAMIDLQDWAAARRRSGGAPIKVRLVKGANLPMERVDAEIHGWPLATWPTKQATDASYKAVLDYALRPERITNVHIGIAGHNLFDIALAWLLVQRRGVDAGVDFEMLLGMAAAQAAVVKRDVGSLVLYTPVVYPEHFDVAIAYLIRRLEEAATTDNYLSAAFALDDDPELFERERRRFLASVADLPERVPAPSRDQNRQLPPVQRVASTGFSNTQDTDPSLAANQQWAEAIRRRMADSALGAEVCAAGQVNSGERLDAVLDSAQSAAARWRSLPAADRAEILYRAADLLESRRADLLEAMGSECGKLLDQGDPEVSEAIDFARYYADQARALETVDGARPDPARVTLVTPPWNFPLAIPAGSTLAALATGSAVVLKPAESARRCAAVLAETLWAAGVPHDVLQYVRLQDRGLRTRLIGDPRIERVILTGAYETAELFRGIRPDLRLYAETSGKNAIIVTPSADFDLAARDVVASAFGHAGQKCSAASLVILVGSAARSGRLRSQLIDATRSLRVGVPWDPAARMGPLIEPAQGKLLRALTTLEAGQSWLLKPEQLDADGRLWRPGIREGVRPGSEFHRVEYFGPVLGVMTAETLADAIAMVNRIDYGLTSGLYSLDEAEIAQWLSTVEAGNLYVNRVITGAIVRRQSFGGWRKSSVGTGAKAGGPNYLAGLVDWRDAEPSPTQVGPDGLRVAAVRAAAGQSADDVAWLDAALATDQAAWAEEFVVVHDVSALDCEQNAFRCCPVPVTVRYAADRPVELIRVVAAGHRTGASITVSAGAAPPNDIQSWLTSSGAAVAVEDDAAWRARVVRLAGAGGRIRLIGGTAAAVAAAANGSPALAIYAGTVVSAGRVELLPFLREQAISVTAHRFGTPRRYGIPPVV
ncbi:proline dehydrogenase family protein [Jongsikchunia kroppenstedtii]|uniref:proline dehydrogenase family protein n=1 Tax=Jongsikchunia kroppenstedtii TaxID=1121721 RepID=UPI00036350FA|nr:bifunctional proline dehydrogenase/L-glutamate gamma-semialdehyde dehydrogenase [Jongsikchunia kroppenstedtii]